MGLARAGSRKGTLSGLVIVVLLENPAEMAASICSYFPRFSSETRYWARDFSRNYIM